MALELRKTKSTNPKLNDAPVVYVHSNNPDPKEAGNETFQAKKILKDSKARWNRIEKRWEWTIMKPEYTDMVIKLATKAVDDANEFIQAKAEKIVPLIKALNDIEEGVRGAKGVSTEDVDDVMAKLTSFIRDLQNEVDAVRFDEKIQKYFEFLASSRGYSFNNMLLIMIQDPQSTDVRSKTNWGLVDFKPKADAPSIIMLRPKTRPKSKGMREKDLANFMKQRGYQSQAQMTKPDWVKLKQIQGLGIPVGGFAAYQAYDVRHTEAIDPNAEAPTRPNLKWSEDEPSEQADKIREAMIAAAQKLGISVDFKDEMGGAKGMSGSGKIHLLKGHDGIGGLSTMAHEMSHEILHQNFLQKQNKEKKSGADDDFLNLYIGRDSSQIMELQAEASAYVVIRNYGMESKTHANYIVLFRNDRKNIEQNLTIITKVANKVIKLTDANMGGIQETIKEELDVAQVANMLGIKMPGQEAMEESTDFDRYEEVVFMQGEEAHTVLDIIDQQGEEAGLKYLMQWHDPGNHMGTTQVPHGSGDQLYQKDGYTLSYSPSLGYVGLIYDMQHDDMKHQMHSMGEIPLNEAIRVKIRKFLMESMGISDICGVCGGDINRYAPDGITVCSDCGATEGPVEELDESPKAPKKGYNYEVYHETLASAFETIREFLAEKGYEVSDDQLFQFGIGGISYGVTKRVGLELSRNGEPAKNMLNVQIYRMDSGRYELNMYYNNSRSMKEYMENDPQDYPWYCSNCDEELQWFDVTYEELHNACGEPVVPNEEKVSDVDSDADAMMYEEAYDDATRNELASYISKLSNALEKAD
ncbi:MAG: hypothetical protein P8J32_08495, partial [bacterium]|nr:hypothetical protein [bacterium]